MTHNTPANPIIIRIHCLTLTCCFRKSAAASDTARGVACRMAEDVESDAWTIAITNRIADASSDTVLTTNQGVMTSGVSKDRRASAAATPKVNRPPHPISINT